MVRVMMKWRAHTSQPPYLTGKKNSDMTKISFLHSGLPSNCISPNMVTADDLEEFPGIAGTGFLARRENRLFYITARHCLTRDHQIDIGIIAGKLLIPIRLQGKTKTASDYLQFEHAISLKHNSEDLPGELIDLLILPISTQEKTKIENICYPEQSNFHRRNNGWTIFLTSR